MVEGVEELGQLEDVFGEVSRLGGGDALINDEGRFRRRQP